MCYVISETQTEERKKYGWQPRTSQLHHAPELIFLHFHFKLLLHFANILFSLITMVASNGVTSSTQTWFTFPGQCLHIIDVPGKKYWQASQSILPGSNWLVSQSTLYWRHEWFNAHRVRIVYIDHWILLINIYYYSQETTTSREPGTSWWNHIHAPLVSSYNLWLLYTYIIV